MWATLHQPRFLTLSGCLLIIPASKLVFMVSGSPPTAPKNPPDSPSPSLVLCPGSEHSVSATDLQIPPSPSLVRCPGSEHSVSATDLQIPPSQSLVLCPGSEHSVWATLSTSLLPLVVPSRDPAHQPNLCIHS